MKKWFITIMLSVTMALLAGCGRGGAEAENTTPGNAQIAANGRQQGSRNGPQGGFGGIQDYGSTYLTSDYENALNPMMQLVLGTFNLEGTQNPIDAVQAAKLLPFWQGVTGGGITNATERNAVLKQIEATMSAEQMQAIAGMQLTNADLATWAEANGVELPQFGGGQGGADGPGGAFANMTEEERTKFREEMQSLSEEERQKRLGEMGIQFGSGQGAGGPGGRQAGRMSVVTKPLIDLLTARAAE